MTLGIIQSVIVIRLLSPAQFGLVGLTMSIGGVIGVSQHLGVVDGAIREIAVLKKKREIGKVFWVSHIVRQIVTIPLSVGLLLLSSVIATKIYGRPEIAIYLQVFAAALVLQGLQDVQGATLTGMKKFIPLYIVQIITAAINIVIFGYSTWKFGVTGFFWAIIITTSIMILMYSAVIAKTLRGHLRLPTKSDIKKYGFRVMRIGAFMYVARIFFIIWQRMPILMLGGVLTADQLGYLNVSSTFGSKLTIIAMALSEVNLSWMSSLYSKQREEFVKVVTKNMHRVLILMTLLTIVLLFFAPEILNLVIGAEYLPAHKLILIMTLAFFLYALTDIGTSSVFVPADSPKLRAYVYGIMMSITGVIIGILLLIKPDPLAAAWAVLAGAVAAYVVMVIVAKLKFNVPVLTKQLSVFLLALLASVWWLYGEPTLIWRIVAFILLATFVLWEGARSRILPTSWLSKSLKSKQTNQEITKANKGPMKFVCFSGAEYNLPTWTNRQQLMSRLSKKHPVLYIEPRVWIIRYFWQNLRKPKRIIGLLKRIIGTQHITKDGQDLYIKSQWNLIPGSREIEAIATFNYFLNKYAIKRAIKKLQFNQGHTVAWIYDTEAAEYLSTFNGDTVIYDCVDNHAAQAGVNRNPGRVKKEEESILKRADIVTVTSHKLLNEKKRKNKNVHLVLNAGDVELYTKDNGKIPPAMKKITKPVIGIVGALDEYKVDFNLLTSVAKEKSDWNFVFIGKPIVDQKSKLLKKLSKLDNIHLLGQINRQEVPQYVYSFDLCMIPYRANRYNESSFPLKFWEFMATGKPIVVTGLPELKVYQNMIGYAKKKKDFIQKIDKQLESSKLKAKDRKLEAKKHSWDKRLNGILKIIKS